MIEFLPDPQYKEVAAKKSEASLADDSFKIYLLVGERWKGLIF